MPTRWRNVVLFVGLVIGVALSVYIPQALATRNSSGTYSLPSGNPVVSGTTIASAHFNNTASDIATELTSSLDRSGRGAMLAPLQCSNGTVALPSLTFGSDTDTGLYRIGANNPAMSAGGVQSQSWTATGSTFPLTLTVTGATTLTGATTQTGVLSTATGITATQSASNTTALTSTGNGSGSGGTFTGGTTGAGVVATGGATSGRGGLLTGSGASAGLRGVGGATSGTGVEGAGGAPNGSGGSFEGTGTGKGIIVGEGFAYFNGTNPASTTAFGNTVTPSNIVKAWGRVTSNGSSASVTSGFNVTSVACGGTGNDGFVVTMATGMSGTNNYAVIVTMDQLVANPSWATHGSASVFTIYASVACDSVASNVDFIVVGLQ